MDQQYFEQQQNKIEADLHTVGRAVREQVHSVSPETTERALVKQSLRSLVSSTSDISSIQRSNEDASLPVYLHDAAPEIKDRVERLVEDAFIHGVAHAVTEAEKSGPFVVDALHDALADRFYDELKKRKII